MFRAAGLSGKEFKFLPGVIPVVFLKCIFLFQEIIIAKIKKIKLNAFLDTSVMNGVECIYQTPTCVRSG